MLTVGNRRTNDQSCLRVMFAMTGLSIPPLTHAPLHQDLRDMAVPVPVCFLSDLGVMLQVFFQHEVYLYTCRLRMLVRRRTATSISLLLHRSGHAINYCQAWELYVSP